MRRTIAVAFWAMLAAGCAAAPSEQPSATDVRTLGPPSSEPTAAPTETLAGPSPSIDPELGVQPDPYYPESSAIGIGMLRITSPKSETVRWWIACEWSTTKRVAYLYNGDGSPQSWGIGPLLRRNAAGAPSVRSQTLGVTASPKIVMTPTPKEAFERPIGDDPALLDLAGSVQWECGPRPSTVPTPAPPEPAESPRRRLDLPRAKLITSGETYAGVRACGLEFGSGGHIYGSADCGARGVPVAPFADTRPDPIRVRPGDVLAFILPRASTSSPGVLSIWTRRRPSSIAVIGHMTWSSAQSTIGRQPQNSCTSPLRQLATG